MGEGNAGPGRRDLGKNCVEFLLRLLVPTASVLASRRDRGEPSPTHVVIVQAVNEKVNVAVLPTVADLVVVLHEQGAQNRPARYNYVAPSNWEKELGISQGRRTAEATPAAFTRPR